MLTSKRNRDLRSTVVQIMGRDPLDDEPIFGRKTLRNVSAGLDADATPSAAETQKADADITQIALFLSLCKATS